MGRIERCTGKEIRPALPGELQVRIPCRGRRAAEVLGDLDWGLTEALAKGRDPLVVLDDLGALADSIVILIQGIARRLADYPRTVAFWESSGYAEAFLSVMEKKEAADPEGPAASDSSR